MIIPDWDPGKLLLVLKEIKIGLVGGMALAVIVQREDILLGILSSVNSSSVRTKVG